MERWQFSIEKSTEVVPYALGSSLVTIIVCQLATSEARQLSDARKTLLTAAVMAVVCAVCFVFSRLFETRCKAIVISGILVNVSICGLAMFTTRSTTNHSLGGIDTGLNMILFGRMMFSRAKAESEEKRALTAGN